MHPDQPISSLESELRANASRERAERPEWSFGTSLLLSLLLHACVIVLANPTPQRLRNSAAPSGGMAGGTPAVLHVELPKPAIEVIITSPAAPAAAASPAPQQSAATSPRYYRGKELTRQPEVIGGVGDSVDAPLGENAGGESGDMLVQLIISRNGKLISARVAGSTLSREAQAALLRQLDRASFQPGEVDGAPVDSEMMLMMSIQGTGVGNSPIPQLFPKE